MKDLVSVVITSYNRLDRLKKALDSVRQQKYSPIEIVIVDDASNKPIKESIKDKNIRLIRHKKNRGLAAARNTGFRAARGKYIAFLDDDDEFVPKKIEKQVKLLNTLSQKYAFVYCGQKVYRPNGTYFVMKPRHKGNIKISLINKGISSISSTYLFSKSALEDVGGFDENLKNSIDHDLWMSFASKGWSCDFVDEPLVINYRKIRSVRMTTDINNRLKEVEKYIKKWSPTFRSWYKKEYISYISRYRYNVYEMFTYDLLMRGDLRNALRVYIKLLRTEVKVTLTQLPLFFIRGSILFSLSLLYAVIPPQSKIRYY